jgi:O-antigen/teichoic acid export membrane protein
MTIPGFIDRPIHLFRNDSLFRNAALLMSSTAIMSALGFGFWIFVSHLYTPSQIGVASALIAITTLISNLSLLGLNAGLIRFLPKSKNQGSDINAAVLIVAAATIIASAIYVLIGGHFGADISILSSSWHKIGFIILMTTVSLNSLTDAVFIANRRAEFHTAAYAVLGVVKLILPVFLIPFGSLGIFLAYILAVVVSLLLSIFFMRRSCGYHFRAKPNWALITGIRKYASNNYFGVILGGLPSQILPLVIIQRLGSANAAYFSMAWMMANLLYVIPSAATQSLLAESSFNPLNKLFHIKHTTKILGYILIPAIVVSVAVAPYLLQVFGVQYSSGSTVAFQIFAVGTIFIAANSIGNTIMNIEQRTGGIVTVQFVISAMSLLLAWPLIHYGVNGVAVALVGGNAAGTVVHLILQLVRRHKLAAPAQQNQNHGIPDLPVLQTFAGLYGLSGASIGKDIGGGDRSSTVILSHKGKRYVLKVHNPDKRSLEDIREEVEFTSYLADKNIPVPKYVTAVDGQTITQLTVGKTKWLGVLMLHEDGEHPAVFSDELLREMALMQARIHAAGIVYAEQKSPQSAIFSKKALKSTFLPFVPKGLSHFDFDGGNILVNNNRVSCVLDFEGMRYDPILVCIFFTLTQLHATARNMNNISLYLKSYQEIRRLGLFEKVIIRIALAFNYRAPRLIYANI